MQARTVTQENRSKGWTAHCASGDKRLATRNETHVASDGFVSYIVIRYLLVPAKNEAMAYEASALRVKEPAILMIEGLLRGSLVRTLNSGRPSSAAVPSPRGLRLSVEGQVARTAAVVLIG